ncbi:hypothetical protein CONPUDRAFT_135773 [Coniophora puteana RWD-64-598 SS2]|uniref:Uncharacterized protein n=1 Tax=Coniophora puteana (strain RWD-64-598) TaxID=741705 RepID=A0A5M3N051_CONPW|nr:uncharacterized protein CONPUDRAFT_135773 [Coniophora puteana RWD-64-598 SS2]EIW84271.1 hypothetical protein CONPUDRAFT_135773 [Coniophora puteana RWD-64-598 SS2]
MLSIYTCNDRFFAVVNITQVTSRSKAQGLTHSTLHSQISQSSIPRRNEKTRSHFSPQDYALIVASHTSPLSRQSSSLASTARRSTSTL